MKHPSASSQTTVQLLEADSYTNVALVIVCPFFWAFSVSRDSNIVTGSRISRDWANPESRGIMRARFSRFSGLILLFFKDFMTVLGVNLLLKK